MNESSNSEDGALVRQPGQPLSIRSASSLIARGRAMVAAAGRLATLRPNIRTHDAEAAGDLDIVKKHLAVGADVDLRDEDGWTPLHCAAWKGHTEEVNSLIARGADLAATIDIGHKRLERQLRMFDWPSDEYAGSTALHLAAWSGHTAALDALIAAGADINSGNEQAETALHWAVRRGRIGAVEGLLASGADPNAGGTAGGSPIHLSVRTRNWWACSWLTARTWTRPRCTSPWNKGIATRPNG